MSAELAQFNGQAVKPDNVVLELCRDRTGVLYTAGTEASNAPAKNDIGKQVRLARLGLDTIPALPNQACM